jgi:ADP-ribosylation factor GTPase-activating protein 2/3
MKVGGNESATTFFQKNGGSAALKSKDPKVKYTSPAAVKYKDELKRRAAKDAQEYPGEVVINDSTSAEGNDSGTPAGETDDDFFSSWDKPSIKKPTPPPSRTATPPVMGRTPSPFLSAGNGNNAARSKSPLGGDDSGASTPDSSAEPSAAVPKATPSAALRKGLGASGARRGGSILGAKKTQRLGAKKIGTGEVIDFDAAEKKAKEEAERIEKLGYDPDAEAAEAAASASVDKSSSIAAPAAAKPISGGFGATAPTKSNADVERIGAGVQRLGFGQIGSKASPAASSQAKKLSGFGSTTRGGAAEEADRTARDKFGTQKSLSSDEFFGRNTYDPNALTEARTRLQGFEGAGAISSNAYFGRPEEDEALAGGLGDGDLESTARDFVRKFGATAGEDLENLSSLVGEGASKLQSKSSVVFQGTSSFLFLVM